MTPKKKLLLLVLNFVLFFVLYVTLLQLDFAYISVVYLFLSAGLAVAYATVNRGFSRPPEPEALSDDYTPAEKAALIEAATARFRRAQILLLFLLPIVTTVMLDILYLFLLEPLLAALGRTV